MKIIIGHFIILLFLFSCGSNSSDQQLTSNKKASPEKTTSSCLGKFIQEPCSIFTNEQIAEIAEIDISTVEMEEPYNFVMMKKASCFYKWNSGRKGQVKTALGMIDVDLDESIRIGSIIIIDKEEADGTYQDWFDKKYRALTPEEIESYEKMYQKKLADESEEVQKAGGSLKNILDKSKMVSVEGVGDRAAAETLGKLADVTLHALHGNTVFMVNVNISEDQETNLNMAKKVANAAIQRCE